MTLSWEGMIHIDATIYSFMILMKYEVKNQKRRMRLFVLTGL